MSKSSLEYAELSGLKIFLNRLIFKQEKTLEEDSCIQVLKNRIEELSKK
jgi:hypothetical protein